MLLFGHAGIPLGVVWLSEKAATWVALKRAKREPGWCGANPVPRLVSNPSPIGSIATRIDYRLILLGSLLPDIIDKPLGIYLLRDALSNGRIFSHTLLFVALLTAAGIYLYVNRKSLGLLCLSFGSLTHLVLDKMWLDPRTFLWPLYGWTFEKVDISHWLEEILTSLQTEPSVYIPEIIGALLLGAFFFNLSRQGKLYSFFRTGKKD